MEELESQVAKIQIGNFKNANSFVYILTEKASGGDAELFALVEFPLFNPAAGSSCEKISLAIAGALKRTYRQPSNDNTFENAIANLNEELGKLAESGQTNWIDKLNCVVAVKDGIHFHIATCGKVSAYLYRNGEFTDISCSPAKNHPLKTFENYASGKMRLGDLTILSTTQLFNHLSIDRLKNILSDFNFLTATQTIIEILKENAGPEVAFGTILNLQVPPGQTPDGEIDLEDYVTETPRSKPILGTVLGFFKKLLTIDSIKRKPSVALPKISFAGIKQFGTRSRHAAAWAGKAWTGAWQFLKAHKGLWDVRTFSFYKKIFLVSIFILLLAFITNLSLTARYKEKQKQQAQATDKMKSIQSLISQAEALLLYQDQEGAKKQMREVLDQLPDEASLTPEQKELRAAITGQLAELENKAEKVKEVEAVVVGNLGPAERLVSLPKHLAVQVGSTIINFDKTSGLIQDGTLRSSEQILWSLAVKNMAVVFNGSSLLVWDYDKGLFGQPYSQNIPAAENFAGLAYYPTNSRVYTVNKQTGQIISYLITDRTVSRPVISVDQANNLGSSLDLAIDGSIYVLNANGVTKYNAGKLADFNMPTLLTPFSGTGRIYTEIGWKYLYILDAGNNRVIILDKKGDLVNTITSRQFTKLKDFKVDETQKTIYLLNDTTLLKINF